MTPPDRLRLRLFRRGAVLAYEIMHFGKTLRLRDQGEFGRRFC
jgi:hypothetical protein